VTSASRHARPRSTPGLLARRLALLALFEAEFRPGSAPAALERLAAEKDAPSDVVSHAAEIVGGVEAHRPELDARIAVEAPLIPVPELGRVVSLVHQPAVAGALAVTVLVMWFVARETSRKRRPFPGAPLPNHTA